METILITGGCGYVGSRVALKLHEKGHKVIVVDKATPEERNTSFPPEIEFRKADLRFPEQAQSALKDAKYVLHLAANIGPIDYMRKFQADIIQENSAIDATVYPILSKNKAKAIIYSSSSMVFQHPPEFPYKEEHIEKINPPQNIYGFSKLLGEYFCKAYSKQYNLPYVIIRYHNIYGPGEDSKGSTPGDIHVIPALLEKVLIKKQHPIELLGNPDATRPFVFVDDAIEATIRIIEETIKGNEKILNNDFNIGNSKYLKIKDLAKIIWENHGDDRPFEYKVIETKSNTAMRREVNIEKIKNTIGWEPTTELIEGISKTADWIKNR